MIERINYEKKLGLMDDIINFKDFTYIYLLLEFEKENEISEITQEIKRRSTILFMKNKTLYVNNSEIYD